MGAEVEISFLFADVRRPSELARRTGSMELARVMQRFYTAASDVLLANGRSWTSSSGTRSSGSSCPS